MPLIFLIPPKLRSSFSISRVIVRISFLLRPSMPFSIIASSSFRRRIDCLTVLKLVNIPPNQRWFTKGISQRSASSRMILPAARLVPTNKIVPRFAAIEPIKLTASLYKGRVFSKLIMWILLRSPKM